MEKIIYLIGHGTLRLDAFLEILKEKQVDMLIDVRSVPFSKFVPDFNKDPLKESLLKHNIEYVHMGSMLGGRRDPEWFNRHMTTEVFERGITTLQESINGSIAAVMCSEIDYRKCHRRFIGQKLADGGFVVEDISKKGIVQRICQKTLGGF